MTTLEQFYIQKFHEEGTLMPEQYAGDKNRLFTIIIQTKPNEHEHKDNNTPTTDPPTKG
jgi:hypothetical protein